MKSLYNKTKEDICNYMEKYYEISDETKQIILNEFIDGEVLFEFDDEDFKALKLSPFALTTLKDDINKEKTEKKEEMKLSKKEIMKKFKSIHIRDPFQYIGFNSDNSELKIGQRKLLKKYENFFNIETNDINSNGTEILFYLKNQIKISDESLKKLLGITGRYFFEMNEDKIDAFDIEIEDKNKLKNLLRNSQNINKEEKMDNDDIIEIEKKMKLEDMIIYEDDKKKITMALFYEKYKENEKIISEENKKKNISKLNPYKLYLDDTVFVNIISINDELTFNFLIGNLNAENILRESIKAKLEINDKILDIDIISNKQID